MRPSWWLDWTGECVAIIASGPSTRKEDVEALRDRIHVVAIKKNVELAPWADVVYGCDEPWWRSVKGLPDFKGLKLCYAPNASARFPEIHRIEIIDLKSNHLCFDRLGTVGSGGNSGFQILNIVAQFGVTGILLMGFDMADNHKELHWYGRNGWSGATNPDTGNFKRWRKAYEFAAGQLEKMNVDVVNASSVSALKCFRRASVSDALRGWGL